jgi:MFS family permease
MAILGSVSGGVLAKRLGLKNLLWLALLANELAQLALAASAAMGEWAFASIFLGTALLGLGFGLSGAPLNSYPPAFFPQRRDSALVALHTAIGIGFASGPLLVGWFIGVAHACTSREVRGASCHSTAGVKVLAGKGLPPSLAGIE